MSNDSFQIIVLAFLHNLFKAACPIYIRLNKAVSELMHNLRSSSMNLKEDWRQVMKRLPICLSEYSFSAEEAHKLTGYIAAVPHFSWLHYHVQQWRYTLSHAQHPDGARVKPVHLYCWNDLRSQQSEACPQYFEEHDVSTLQEPKAGKQKWS